MTLSAKSMTTEEVYQHLLTSNTPVRRKAWPNLKYYYRSGETVRDRLGNGVGSPNKLLKQWQAHPVDDWIQTYGNARWAFEQLLHRENCKLRQPDWPEDEYIYAKRTGKYRCTVHYDNDEFVCDSPVDTQTFADIVYPKTRWELFGG